MVEHTEKSRGKLYIKSDICTQKPVYKQSQIFVNS